MSKERGLLVSFDILFFVACRIPLIVEDRGLNTQFILVLMDSDCFASNRQSWKLREPGRG